MAEGAVVVHPANRRFVAGYDAAPGSFATRLLTPCHIVWLVGLVALPLMCLSGVAMLEISGYLALRDEGRTASTTATIIDITPTSTLRGRENVVVAQFWAEGGYVFLSQYLPDEPPYAGLRAGDTAPVTYVRTDPDTAALFGHQTFPLGGLLLLMLWLAVSSAGILFMIYRVSRNRALLKRGQVLPGEVVIWERRSKSQRHIQTITYRFTSPLSGRFITHKETITLPRHEVDSQPPLLFRSPVLILYQDDTHFRLL